MDVVAGILVVGHKQGEARVYQFSQEEQEVSCVDLDGKRPGEHHARRQPAGFQCILQCTHHAASICSIALACCLKLAALADEAGVVSLLELTRVWDAKFQEWSVSTYMVVYNISACLYFAKHCAAGPCLTDTPHQHQHKYRCDYLHGKSHDNGGDCSTSGNAHDGVKISADKSTCQPQPRRPAHT